MAKGKQKANHIYNLPRGLSRRFRGLFVDYVVDSFDICVPFV